jgi:hypothetical protein
MKNILLACAFLALLILLVLHFSKIKQYEAMLEMENLRNSSLNDYMLYYKFKSVGDSLMLKGGHKEALVYYFKADSVLGQSNLSKDNLAYAQMDQQKKDSLENLSYKLSNIKNELIAFRNNKKKEGLYKDSIIEISKEEIKNLNSNLVLLKDSLTKAKDEIKKISKLIGKLEIEVFNGTKVYYAGDILNGKANGFGYGLFSTGGVYEGEWKNNLRHGKGKYTWKDGNKYEGDYYDDKRQGKGTYLFASGEKYIGEWLDNKRSGKGTMYAKDGSVIVSGEWVNDEVKK